MMRYAKSTIGLITLVLLAAIPLGCSQASGNQGSGQRQDEPTTSLEDLQDVAQLQTMFNKDAGTPRLILLLSPT